MTRAGRPSVAQLWRDAGGDRERFAALLDQHGYPPRRAAPDPPPPAAWPFGKPRTCPGCGAQIVFARVAGGKVMPINAVPDPAGNAALSRAAPAGTLMARVLRKGEQPEKWEKRGMPHFATCPDYQRRRARPKPGLAGQAASNVVPLRPRGGRASRAPPRLF